MLIWSYYLPISSFLCTFFISTARNLHQEKELQRINMKQPIFSERAKMFPLLLLIRCYNFRVFGGSFNFGCHRESRFTCQRGHVTAMPRCVFGVFWFYSFGSSGSGFVVAAS